jgi:hypothetical protein
MKREVNLNTYKVVTTTTIDNDKYLILIENDSQFFYINDEIEKIFDISQMPYYIKNDWIETNKINPTVKFVNYQISKLNNEYGLFEEELNLLKIIRRNLIINGIIE